MKKFVIFIFNLIIKCSRDGILDRAAGLTLRVLLAFFPFLVFLMSLTGFLDIDTESVLYGLYAVLPDEISELASSFISEISQTRNTGLLSAALFFSVYNTTNGFRAVIRHINMAYDTEERRGAVSQTGLSFVLMLLFSAALIIMLGLLVFWRRISGFCAAVAVLFMFTAFIYKLACEKPLPAKHILPGTAFTVVSWIVISLGFGFFTRNFTQLPMIYGSIAGVFLLVLWLNAVGIALLLGNEINVMVSQFHSLPANRKQS
jgi:membrane protein